MRLMTGFTPLGEQRRDTAAGVEHVAVQPRPGTEAGPGTGQHDGTRLAIAVGTVKCRSQGGNHGIVKGVVMNRIIQRQ